MPNLSMLVLPREEGRRPKVVKNYKFIKSPEPQNGTSTEGPESQSF